MRCFKSILPTKFRALVFSVMFATFLLYISSYRATSRFTTSAMQFANFLSSLGLTDNSILANSFDLYDPTYHDSVMRTSLGLDKETACQIPSLNPWDKTLWPHFSYWLKLSQLPPIKCKDDEKQPPLAYMWNNAYIKINESAASMFKDNNIVDQCFLGYANKTGVDQPTFLSNFTKLSKGEWFRIRDSEQFIVVRCGGDPNQQKWPYSNVFIRLVVSPTIEKKVKRQQLKPSRKLSVLYLLHDGVSHLAARRSWNKTYYYLVNEQRAVALHRYHTVGLNTFPNVIPWLTGHHEEELPSYAGKPFNDVNWPLIWKNFSSKGYITAYAEDSRISTFVYLKNGFTKAPTDYFFESYFRLTTPGPIQSKGSCIFTGETEHQNHLRIMNQFLELHGKHKYFYFALMNTLSHQEWEPLVMADAEYTNFLKGHFDKGTFNNTLLIVGSDHGNRFGPIRKTSVGRTEERLPLQLLIFPEWYRKEHAEAFKVLESNARYALLTPYDMHETLLDVLYGEKIPRKVNSNYTRGMSLFRNITLSRTCPDAGVPPTYCVCRKTTSLPTDDSTVIAAVNAAVKRINKIREPHANICETWTLYSVVDAQLAEGTSSMKQSNDPFTDYILIFELKPAKARFEATVRKHVNSEVYRVEGGIARISLYDNTADCITSNGPEGPFMRNYCYCRKKASSELPS